jgi:hypothetical protein
MHVNTGRASVGLSPLYAAALHTCSLFSSFALAIRLLPTVPYTYTPLMSSIRLRIDGRTFRDPHNREVTLHGINCAADAKFPATPNQPSHIADNFFDGDNVSFVNRPFSLEDSTTHFSRLRSWGYNTIRYVFTWEAIEHAGPGKYDEEWIDHTIALLRKAKEYGFYIFMDPHQDVVGSIPMHPDYSVLTYV